MIARRALMFGIATVLHACAQSLRLVGGKRVDGCDPMFGIVPRSPLHPGLPVRANSSAKLESTLVTPKSGSRRNGRWM
jgi:hypothetical protein